MVSSMIRFDKAASPLPTRDTCDDDRLQREVSNHLQSSGYAALAGLECQVDRRKLTLYGSVPSYYLKQLAQHYAGRAKGLETIDNHVAVEQRAG